ncbi:Arabinosidase A [Aureobasidium pullulans]|nr:Arabinosidase A [Aureobasidium pullulans]
MASLATTATALLALAVPYASAINLKVSSSGGNASSPLLYGLMIEDISNSIDGGLYGQTLQNNGFQGDSPGLTAWTAVGSSTISQDNSSALSDALPSSLLIKSNGTSGTVGASNSGYGGIRVLPDHYGNYFYVKGSYNGNVTLSLVGSDGGVLASTHVSVNSNSSAFGYYETYDMYAGTAAADGNNTWQFTFDASLATDGQLNLGLPQLFPTTYKGRFNGMNNEIATVIDEIGGKFLRLPGGNNLEGASIPDRWIWNNTIGPLIDRPGRQGDWTYPNTDGMGLIEYLYWCQDMSLEPVLAVWDGLVLADAGAIAGDELKPYVQDSLNELEYLTGDTSTEWGALRASHGHPDPFHINYVEIGNEDMLNKGLDNYQSRFDMYYEAIHAAYPNMTIISSVAPGSTGGNGSGINVPEGAYQDLHQYLPPKDFIAKFNTFDNWDRSQPLLVGEYASTTFDNGSATIWTNMMGSVSEAVYMIGMERNSDVVKMACYAPLLEHFDRAEWSPDLIGFDATTGVTRSTSYFVQQMFASNKGDTILSVDSDTGFGPVYWVASSAGSTSFVKLANYGGDEQNVTLTLDGKTSGSLTVLSGGQYESNYPGQENVKPVVTEVTGSNGTFSISLPGWSVAVLSAE